MVAAPVSPLFPMICPDLTSWPSVTFMLERCA